MSEWAISGRPTRQWRRVLWGEPQQVLRTEPRRWWKGQNPSLKSLSVLGTSRWSVRKGRVFCATMLNGCLSYSQRSCITHSPITFRFSVGRWWGRISSLPFIFLSIHHPFLSCSIPQILKCISAISSFFFKKSLFLQLNRIRKVIFEHGYGQADKSSLTFYQNSSFMKMETGRHSYHNVETKHS